MANINIQILEEAIQKMRGTLGEGLISSDIWEANTGKSLAGYNVQPQAVAVFDALTTEISNTLDNAGFPGLGSYYMIHLNNDSICFLINHAGSQLLQGILFDAKKVNIGLFFSLVLKDLQDAVLKAYS
ncbi:hypothetical protein EBB59_06380 [Lysobacter pythonis]|uniref:Roadblock/LAMTOR2 domain-containing protein n=1 Tax=Solilutibacter pythonis TaxID=2483112 RepID=A0A3M2I0J9_9GAMM|nr:hypothetical protein [Lysobacter pythonis]RMH93159.1 hypothetical protein EBB59_06380 [Lysobacter pythonis]